jgi:hypothetical protein
MAGGPAGHAGLKSPDRFPSLLDDEQLDHDRTSIATVRSRSPPATVAPVQPLGMHGSTPATEIHRYCVSRWSRCTVIIVLTLANRKAVQQHYTPAPICFRLRTPHVPGLDCLATGWLPVEELEIPKRVDEVLLAASGACRYWQAVEVRLVRIGLVLGAQPKSRFSVSQTGAAAGKRNHRSANSTNEPVYHRPH